MKKNVLLDEKTQQSPQNQAAFAGYEAYYSQSPGDNTLKLENFPKYVTREAITRFLARHEVFLEQLDVCGSIVELGVCRGASLMTWAHLSSIYEPTNYTRQIIGFDTFSGFPEISEKDAPDQAQNKLLKKGGLDVGAGMKQDIERAVSLWDMTRYLNHIPKVALIQGDIKETLPKYIHDNPHLVVSMLHLDVDLYEPTKLGLELLTPRMPRGAVLLFDQLNFKRFPGETQAVLDSLGIHTLRIQRIDFAPNIAYAIVE